MFSLRLIQIYGVPLDKKKQQKSEEETRTIQGITKDSKWQEQKSISRVK